MTSVASSNSDRSTLALLRGIAARPPLHARLLNTISMLEYIGARKIMKSQRADEFDLELLTHVSDEIKHAWLIKRMAAQLDADGTGTYSAECLLGGSEAEAYIQELDAAAKEELCGSSFEGSESWVNYLYTSLLIEERADQFYGVYQGVLKDLGMDGPLKALMKDESKHLAQMARKVQEVDPEGAERLARLREVERAGFEAFLGALWRELEAL